MKVTKKEAQGAKSISQSNVAGTKFKNISSSKIKPRIEIDQNEEVMSATQHIQQKGTEQAKIEPVNGANVIPLACLQDSVSLSTETPVLLSSDGILRQALLSFSHSGQDEKVTGETAGKKNGSISKSQTVAVGDIKLSHSVPGPLPAENIQKTLSHGRMLSSKSLSPGTVLTGSLPLGNLPLVSLPPVSFTSEAFSHGGLPLMSLTSGPLPPVSELPRPGNIPSLSCLSSGSSRNTVSAGPGIVTTMPTSFSGGSGSVPVLSEVPSYEVPQLGTHALKVLVSLSASVHRTAESHVLTQTSAASKDSSVTFVYSSVPKLEPSCFGTSYNLSQKLVPLPPMSEMKSRHNSHLQTLSHGKVDDSSGASVNDQSESVGDTIQEVVPVNSDILMVADCTSQASISLLSSPVSGSPIHGSSTNPIKLDENHDSTEELNQVDPVQNESISHSVNFEANNGSSPDLNHIIIPVSNGITSGKLDDHHVLSAQDIGQIITIPLTSSAIYGHSVGISIPISGNAVPLSMPLQVSSSILPMSCNLLPVPSSTATIHPPSVPTETSRPLVPTTSSVRTYPGTVIPSVSPNSTAETAVQHSRLSMGMSNLVPVTSSMTLPLSSTSTMTSVTSASTAGPSVTSSASSVPVTCVTVSVPSSSSSSSSTTTTHSTSVESVPAYAVQSPAEILSQLSKAGVFPTMSSSQVSSVLSALAADACHMDLESESSHHAELMTQQQVMHLSSSADKVSTLTQTEDLELGHTVELGCNIDIHPQHNKVISVSEEIHLVEGGRLMEQHLHLLKDTRGHAGIAATSLPLTVPFPEKQTSISNLPSIDGTQISDENVIIKHQVEVNPREIDPVETDPCAPKETPSVYPGIVSKLNLHSNELTTANPIKSNLIQNLNMSRHVGETLTSSHCRDLKCEQRMVSVFVKQENFENSMNQKVNKAGGDGPKSKKRRLQGINNGKAASECTSAKCSKEAKKQNIKDLELDTYVEQVACYKCKFCPFLTLEKRGVTMHVKLVHGSQLPSNEQETRHNIKCPGCKNVFFTSKSLRVHLSQDHQVGDEELKALVEVVVRSSYMGAKAKNKFDKKRRKNMVKSCLSEICNPIDNECNDKKETSSVTNCVTDVSSAAVPDILVDEHSKIRVRNLNSEAFPEVDKTPVITAADDICDDASLCSNGESDGDMREGTLVIDDSAVMQQKLAKISVDDGCEFKMVKTDTEQVPGLRVDTEIIVCSAESNSLVQKSQKLELKSHQGTSPVAKKKPGRPKGSKNIRANGYRKSSSARKELAEKELGYRCDIDGCPVRLRSHDNIEYHRRCHHDEKFLCPECSQETSHWKSLSTHLWRYHVIDMELFACDQCSYKSNSYSKLMNLHRRIHGDERPFLCDNCGKGFKNRKQLRNHKVIHVAKQKQKSGPLGECDVCGRAFTNPRMLRIHKDNVHGKLRPHLCNFCGYSASSRSTLKMHMRLHTGEKPFHCDECEYVTADHNSLRRHKMRHSGDKPYKCPHCSYACIQSSTYKAHLNTKHPGMETGLMFNCDLCSFRSVRRDNYLAHVAEHKHGTHSNNRHRKRNSSKPQHDSHEKTKQSEISSGLEKSHLPTVINISHITPMECEEGLLHENAESSDNMHLIYNGSSVEGLLQQSSEEAEGQFEVEISSDSVIHLVENLDTNSNTSNQHVAQNGETLCVANIETVTEMPLTPELEAEQITGDIQDIKEPQELKFKVGEDLAS